MKGWVWIALGIGLAILSRKSSPAAELRQIIALQKPRSIASSRMMQAGRA